MIARSRLIQFHFIFCTAAHSDDCTCCFVFCSVVTLVHRIRTFYSISFNINPNCRHSFGTSASIRVINKTEQRVLSAGAGEPSFSNQTTFPHRAEKRFRKSSIPLRSVQFHVLALPHQQHPLAEYRDWLAATASLPLSLSLPHRGNISRLWCC